MPQEVVIVDRQGQEHVFPPGFDPKRAADIVRQRSTPAQAAAPTPETPQAPQSFTDWANAIKRREQERTQSGREFLTGVGKSIWGAVEGGGQILREQFPSLDRGPEVSVPFSATPNTPSERAGKTVGNVAQFFAPAGMLTKGKAALRTGQGLLDALVAAGLEGGSAAAVESAQKGSADSFARTAALAGGAGLGMQTAMAGAKGAFGWLGERIERALVKATTADERNGFKVSNIFKHKLGGSLSQTYDKAEAKLAELGGQLRETLSRRATGGRAPEVDVLGAIADAAEELQRNAAKTFGQNNAIGNAVSRLLDDPLFQQLPSGRADLFTANQVKQAIGDLGAWLHDPSGRVMVDPDSKAMEVVANTVYSKLKTAIERQALGDVAAINSQISEIIPIRQAIIRRIPVEQRANVLNLGDLIGVSTGTWGIALANRALRAGQTAQLATEAAERIAPEAAGGVAARTAGASQAPR